MIAAGCKTSGHLSMVYFMQTVSGLFILLCLYIFLYDTLDKKHTRHSDPVTPPPHTHTSQGGSHLYCRPLYLHIAIATQISHFPMNQSQNFSLICRQRKI